MPTIKECRCCGYLMKFPENVGVLACPACSTRNQEPKMEGTVLANFRHAIRLQKAMEFDRARASYDLVLNFAPDNAEALWGRLLCHYGAAPVSEDGRNFYMIHRPDEMVPLREQPDYEYACQLADPALRSQIQEEAAYIDRAILRIRHMAETKPDFDIFICHKCSHPEGGYTEDYKRANNLYMRLKDKGYRVFFAPLEMEKHAAGEDYEAMIYHALKTSKVMLVVCSDSEYLHSKWVQAEWLRFLRMMSGDDEKRLIPLLYGGMDPCRLPKHFQYRHLQCINMEGDGYELVEQNVEKIIRKCGGESGEEPPPPPPPRKSGGWILLLVLALLAAAAAGAYFLRNEVWTPCEHLHSSWQTKVSYKRNNSVYHTVTEVQTKVCNDCGEELQRRQEPTREEAHVYVDGECQHCGTQATPTPSPTTPTPSPTTPTPSPTTPTPSPTPTLKPILFSISISFDNKSVRLTWNSVEGAEQYRVYRARGRGTEGVYIGTVSTAVFEDKEYVDNLWNEYSVQAYNAWGVMIGESVPTAEYIERKPNLSISGATSPSGTHVKGRNFAIRGVVSTDCGKITYISGVVRNNSTGSIVCSASAAPNSTSYNLQGHINNSLKFGDLPAGKYTYTIIATAQNGSQSTTTTLISSSFTVK